MKCLGIMALFILSVWKRASLHLYCGNLYSTFGAPLPFIKSTLKLELALHSVPHLQK